MTKSELIDRVQHDLKSDEVFLLLEMIDQVSDEISKNGSAKELAQMALDQIPDPGKAQTAAAILTRIGSILQK